MSEARRKTVGKSTKQNCIHWLHHVPMKDAGLRIRVQRELRKSFLEACQAEDRPAVQVLRDLMRAYVRKHQEAKGANAGRQLNIDEPSDQER